MSGNGNPLFLQFRQTRQSVFAPSCGASMAGHSGKRLVMSQRILQVAGDMFLGWTTGGGEDKRRSFIRQLNNAMLKPVNKTMKEVNLKSYAQLCCKIIALAHACSGNAAVLSGDTGKNAAFAYVLAVFNVAYNDQKEREHTALVRAVYRGRIEA
jgi:hypothetical protein